MYNLRGFPVIRRMDKVPIAQIREYVGSDAGGWMKGLMKVFSGGSTLWREWKVTELLRGSM